MEKNTLNFMLPWWITWSLKQAIPLRFYWCKQITSRRPEKATLMSHKGLVTKANSPMLGKENVKDKLSMNLFYCFKYDIKIPGIY